MRRPLHALLSPVALTFALPVALAAATVSAPPAQAAGYVPSPSQQRVATALNARILNPALGSAPAGHVVDIATGATVWSRGSTSSIRMPASNTKIPTALTALRTFGPDARLTTRVLLGPANTSTVSVFLRGMADPALSTAGLDSLAAQTLAKLPTLGTRTLTVAVDDYLFPAPTLATGWSSGYYPSEVAPVRSLIVDQHEVMDTAMDAGKVFAARLAARGAKIRVVFRSQAATTWHLLASWASPPMSALVARMLNVSDNDYAEALLRVSAIRRVHSSSWAGAQAAQRSVMQELGAPLSGVELYDGSGLSRSDRVTPAFLTWILRSATLTSNPDLRRIYDADAMPIAGLTGSLSASRGRFSTSPSSCARGKLVAKTGTLRDVVALSGTTTGADGRPLAFSFLINGPASTLTVKQAVDGLAATVHGCW